jgi:hypothetical protein
MTMTMTMVRFADSTTKMDHQVIREISALVSCLPVMSDKDFQLEFLTVRPLPWEVETYKI